MRIGGKRRTTMRRNARKPTTFASLERAKRRRAGDCGELVRPATARDSCFEAAWLGAEIKHDGFRMLALVEGRGTRFYSRRRSMRAENSAIERTAHLFLELKDRLALAGTRSTTAVQAAGVVVSALVLGGLHHVYSRT